MTTSTTGNVEGRARRMRAMIRQLEVDTLELAYADLGGVYAEAASRCFNCDAAAECLPWLDGTQTGERPTFCPNLAVFERFSMH